MALGISLGIVFALLWLAYRIHDLVPGGWTTLIALYLALVVLLIASTVFRRLPRRH
jgi:hypothetical protein